ncbi:MAG: hypothetical protein AB7F98_08325 [Novosphingobium sp.]
MNDLGETNQLLRTLIGLMTDVRGELEKMNDKALLHGPDDIHDAIERASEEICGMISAATDDVQDYFKPTSK